MKRRFLTFVLSCLLLAAFIGTVEAKKIDATSNAGAGVIQLATYPGSRMVNDLTAGWPNEDMKKLLAFYYGLEAESFIIDPQANSTEVLPASEEDEEDFSFGKEVWFGNTIAGLSFADPLSNGPLAETSVTTDQEELAASAPPAGGAKRALNYSLVVPSVSITVNTGATPGKGAPVGGSKTPDVVSYTPDVVSDSPTGNPDVIDGDKPTASVPPVATELDPLTIPINTPTIGPSTSEPKKDPILQSGPKVEVPNDSIVSSPAPVPEPATMVLLVAGIAGLAIGGLGKNKNAGRG